MEDFLMVYDQLKKDNLMALKEKNNAKRVALGIVITRATLLRSEKKAANQELSDEDVLLIIQKVIKEILDEAEAFKNANRLEQYQELIKQKESIEVYLPKMMSKEEIMAEIDKLEDKSMPAIMKHFKTNFLGKVNMQEVSQIARNLK